MQSEDSQEVENLRYQLYAAVAKKRWAQSTVKCLREQLVSELSDVDKYCVHIPLSNKRFTADGTDSFCGFLYGLYTKVRRLAEKKRKDIEKIFKTDLEAVYAFLRSIVSKLRRPRPSS